jgi:hypothetical protein
VCYHFVFPHHEPTVYELVFFKATLDTRGGGTFHRVLELICELGVVQGGIFEKEIVKKVYSF